MSLSQRQLASIQKAGQAVHHAAEIIANSVKTQAESMVSNLTSTPFGPELNQLVDRFKSLSALSQGLVSVEAQMQKLFALASDLANPASDVIVLAPAGKRMALTNDSAVDVVAKPTKAPKKVKAAKLNGKPAGALTPNDTKLQTFLLGALKGGQVASLTGSKMAAGAGLPVGSVGISLKKLLSLGAVRFVGRGAYQLGSAAASSAPEASPEKKPGKAAARKPKGAKAAVAAKGLKKAAAAKKVKVASKRKVKAVAPVDVEVVSVEAAPL